jgi:hypothetical protein
MKDPTRYEYQNKLEVSVGAFRCIESLTINKKMKLIFVKHKNNYANIDPMLSQEKDKCVSLYLISIYITLHCSLTK